ncbi:uncharacterized protein LOC124315343 [Daphnia pulicaria]|uniref:uncharacterized protein LOC124315343 n=1 Tax=Daphnia pulicaria TaxID=35523 RepID=UPI001EEAE84D|nr:uncharacterized protein LOC124315343 [Daphnia pulicaria]
MGGSQRSTVTLRALIPYLVIYRALGLLPINFASETANPSSKPTTPWLCRFRPRLCWRQIGWTRLYSASVFLLVTGFLFEKLPSLESKGKDVVGRLEVANRSSICLNVFVTSAICFCYVGKRMSALTQKMIQCEHDLIALGCHLQNRLAVYCWIVLAIGSVATILNELVIGIKYIRPTMNSATEEEDQSTLLVIFRSIMTPFTAGLMPFVDFSVIQLSLIFSAYLKQLRKEIEHWSSLGLKAKERLRLTYWKVQSLIKEADDIFSPTILIESLSCVAHLTLQINILVGTKIESSESDEYDKHQVFMVTAITTVNLFIRFISSSLFAEMIHRERFKSQRSLYEQSGEEFWSYDLELLVTKRFVHQLTLPLGFTGCGFFKLGKSYLIAMCGTILTYEIVLMDMANSENPATFESCVNNSFTLAQHGTGIAENSN